MLNRSESATAPSLQGTRSKLHQIFLGVAWTVGHIALAKLSTLLCRLYLASMLMPADLGVFGFTILVLGIISTFSEIGLQTALIRARHTGLSSLASSIFWLLLCINIVITIVANVVLTYHPNRNLYNLSTNLVIHALTITLVLQSASIAPVGLMIRQRRLKELATIEIIGVAVGAVLALLLGSLDMPLWGLAAQHITSIAVTCILAIYFCGWRPKLLINWVTLRSLTAFVSPLFLSRMLSSLKSLSESLTITFLLGPGSFGIFLMASSLTEAIRANAASIISRVTLPIFSSGTSDIVSLQKNYMATIRLSTVFLFPAFLIVEILTEPIVRVWLGTQWIDLVAIVPILTLGGLIYACSGPAVEVLQALGRTDELLKVTAKNTLLVAIPLTAALAWNCGLIGAAWGIAIATIVFRVDLLRTLVSVAFFQNVGPILRASIPSIAGLALVTLVTRIIGLEFSVVFKVLFTFLVFLTIGAVQFQTHRKHPKN